ncbi:hypothetical protein F0365_01795 [Nonlabens sp. Ci31]|uniref:hypothetical protein n=1 Tax=Nonlabens sp. Ci31 TaxID=2608253 RepID=UPI001463E090|nr:hypothetical protein [Nonlabens sp. Ci31]QJP33230.1 hypothetical protein F0365_01795 [Nonlabens sp. Ci31]
MRIIQAGLLIFICFTALVTIGAGSHGHISMKNHETATIAYGSIIFASTAFINLIALVNRFVNFKSVMSLIFNQISGLILTFYLVYAIKFNIDGGHFPLRHLLLNTLGIILSVLIVKKDFKQFLE